jgi:hypothetical protein
MKYKIKGFNKRLEIVAHLSTYPVIYDNMYLDGILYFCYRKMTEGENYYNLPRFETKKNLLNIKLPIQKEYDTYLCSMARYNKKNQQIVKYRKRTVENSLIKYCEKQRVYTDQKIYKNYDMPLQVTKTKKIKWIVIGDKTEIAKLLEYCTHIGKKGSQGYGIVDRWEIKETTKKGLRHFPLSTWNKGSYTIDISTYKPPYTNPKNKKTCVLQRF